MTPTFITAGDVRREYGPDGSTTCYYVSRQNAEPIRLQKVISEYYAPGNRIFIDRHGSPWVQK